MMSYILVHQVSIQTQMDDDEEDESAALFDPHLKHGHSHGHSHEGGHDHVSHFAMVCVNYHRTIMKQYNLVLLGFMKDTINYTALY